MVLLLRGTVGPRQVCRGFSGLTFASILFLLSACQQRGESHLAVYNQTLVPVVFAASGGKGLVDYVVGPCAVATFIYGPATSGWVPAQPSLQPSAISPDAVRIVVQPGPAAEGTQDTTVWVTPDLVWHAPGIIVPSLPPCAGSPPTAAPS